MNYCFCWDKKEVRNNLELKNLEIDILKGKKNLKVIALNNPVTYYWKNVSHPDTKRHQRAFPFSRYIVIGKLHF